MYKYYFQDFFNIRHQDEDKLFFNAFMYDYDVYDEINVLISKSSY